MIKIPKKVGITLAITGLIFFGTLAYGVSQIKLDTAKTVIKGGVEPFEEMGSVLLNEKLADEFIQFEYHFLVAEYYAQNKELATARIYYEKAIKNAKASLGEKSIFTHFAYFGESVAEEENGQHLESNEHCRAALKALPDIKAYDMFRCATQSLLIHTTVDKSNPNNIPLYREHLALTEKLRSLPGVRNHLVSTLSLLAKTLDNDGKKDEAEQIWRRILNEARNKDYPKRQFVTTLLDFAYHENQAGSKKEADKALVEATTVAEQIDEDEARCDVLQMKGNLCIDSGELDKANDFYQHCLAVAQKTKNKLFVISVYDSLAELEERRDNLKEREKYLEKAFEFVEESWRKYKRLPKLAIIARANGKIELARNYVKQYELMPKKSFEPTKFIDEKELDALLALCPKLTIGKLKSCKTGFPQMQGYEITLKQLDLLMNAI